VEGREFKTFVAEFGESVFYLKAASVGRDKLETKMGRGSLAGSQKRIGRGHRRDQGGSGEAQRLQEETGGRAMEQGDVK
jgi:hypothetical protein